MSPFTTVWITIGILLAAIVTVIGTQRRRP
jgi:hypothetical protein